MSQTYELNILAAVKDIATERFRKGLSEEETFKVSLVNSIASAREVLDSPRAKRMYLSSTTPWAIPTNSSRKSANPTRA